MRQIRCVACKNAPCEELHHPRGLEFGTGMGKKASHMLVMALCHSCHEEFHRLGRETWETKFAPQADLIVQTQEAVAALTHPLS